MEFRILGPLEVVDGGQALPLRGTKQTALLALLLVHANEVVAEERLLEELWREQRPQSGSSAIRVRVSSLRKALPGVTITTKAHGYVLEVEPDALDAASFERLLARGSAALGAGEPEEAASMLRAALGLWRGPALADFLYESWPQAEIARLEELRVRALEERIEADLALGRSSDLVAELEVAVDGYPLRERLRSQLMLALYRAGRQADALAAYRVARRHLSDELGLEPSPALQRSSRRFFATIPPSRRCRPSLLLRRLRRWPPLPPLSASS
jgi:DNA-binding SARP family transcriptional activator